VKIDIQPLTEADWDDVRRIYKEGIETGNATFETEPPSWNDWDRSHLSNCRLAAWFGDRLVGWAAMSPVSNRCVYEGVAEVSIYIAADDRGGGVGKILLSALVEASEKEGIWTLETGMFPENEASIRLHKSCGFREVGYRERIGQMDGRWRDKVLMERRSKVNGV
jgi:L-amino acid N-acyltransferase YncA